LVSTTNSTNKESVNKLRSMVPFKKALGMVISLQGQHVEFMMSILETCTLALAKTVVGVAKEGSTMLVPI